MPHIDANPIEPGWGAERWYKSYNAADSRIYKRNGYNAIVSRDHRLSGATRALARTINPPAPIVAAVSAWALPPPQIVAANPTPTPASAAFVAAPSATNPPGNVLASMASSYPLSKAQANVLSVLNTQQSTEFKNTILAIMRQCADDCNGGYRDCEKHLAQIRDIYRSTYVDIVPGSWASYRPASYLTELTNMLNNKYVSLDEINKRIAKEQRLHARASVCTILLYDHPAIQKLKNEAAEMFDDPTVKEKDIKAFLESAVVDILSKLTPKEREQQGKFLQCENADQQYAFFEQDACDYSDGDSMATTKLKAKWRDLFKSKRPYDEIRKIMTKDIEQNEVAVQSLRTRIADIESAKAGHIRDKEKKKNAKQEHPMNVICSGSGCNNCCVGQQGLEPLQCAQCKEDWLAMKRGSKSYFCSQKCVNEYGVEHRLLNHAGPECSAHDCVNSCVGTVKLEPLECSQCKMDFVAGLRAAKSYFCSKECVDRSGSEHMIRVHPAPNGDM